jgi:hypothetical protein
MVVCRDLGLRWAEVGAEDGGWWTVRGRLGPAARLDRGVNICDPFGWNVYLSGFQSMTLLGRPMGRNTGREEEVCESGCVRQLIR